MVDWIKADDKSRAWPEGPAIGYFGPKMKPLVSLVFRNEDGTFFHDSDERIAGLDPSHFFYLPEEPTLDT